MSGRWRLWARSGVLGWMLVFAGPTGAQTAAEAEQLSAEVVRLYQAGKYAEAIPLAERALAFLEKSLGPEHPEVATVLNNLAALYKGQGRYGEAEPFYMRSLAIREKALGPEHPDVAQSLNNLARLYNAQGRYAEAEPLYKLSLAIDEKALGPEHPDVATVLNNLALLYDSQGRYAEAEPLYKRSLAIDEKALGPEHPDVATVLNNLAWLYNSQGRYAEAEPLYKRSLAIREKVLGPEHPDVATVLNNLAELYKAQGRYGEAEPLYKRSLAIDEKALGPEHPEVATVLNNLAALYKGQGRYGEAEPFYMRSLAIREKALGPEHPDVAQSLNNLARLYNAQGRYGEAEPLYKLSLAIDEKALGPEHPDVATVLNNLALLYDSQGRYAEAEPLYKLSLAIDEKALGPEHPDVATVLNNLAWLALAQNDLAGASQSWRRATAILKRRAERGLGGVPEGSSKGEAQRMSWYFAGLIKSTHRLAAEGRVQASAREMFQTAQWAQGSEAAATLAQMAARTAGGSAELVHLVRERQDLVGEWQARDKLLIQARSEAPETRNAEAEKALADRLRAIETRLAEIDARFAKDFPDYAALASPKPSSLADVQAALADDEAMVLFLDTVEFKPLPEETFVWVVTKTDVRWLRSGLGTNALQERVTALRCGLDKEGAWTWDQGKRRWLGRMTPCQTLRPDGLADRDPLPFDTAKAHELYRALLGEAEDLLVNADGSGKHLLLVPSGPLTALPFQVLVTKAPEPNATMTSVDWLAKRHALTVLPSVASLASLRRNAKASAASEPFIAFADPVLTRSCAAPSIPKACPGAAIEFAAAETGVTRSAGEMDTAASFMRGGLADVAAVKTRLCPLPDTAFEVACVARSLGAEPSSLVLGRDMTEPKVKNMTLDRYRVVHFATHGLLAGETAQLAKERAEPALVFSPPTESTETDDGLLTASEIAGLKLDADWVVMSACNTAGGATPGAEALSGLAKAFFYAGSRALLVSHWPVNSIAATMLTSRTFAELKKEPSIGRAEAFRRSMLAMMSDKDRPWAAHPSVWAPFVVVGEGGAGR